MKRAIFWLVILLIWFGNTAVAQITLRGFILNQDMFQTNESMDVMLIRNRLRLNTETFGENVGVLTHEVFNLEVINSGFHKILEDVVNNTESYDEAITLFKDQIGLEAKAILQSYFYQKRISNDSNS